MKTGQYISTVVMALVLSIPTACGKPTKVVADAAPPAQPKPVVELPPPFSGVKLGMTQADLEKLFPPGEDISHCAPQLIGGDVPEPIQVPGADKKARSACARSPDIGGPTIRDLSRIMAGSKELGGEEAAEIEDGWIYAVAQVRGSLRAGVVTEAALLQADHGRSETAVGAVTNVTEALFRGGLTFAKAHKTRREVCAVLADTCDDVDPVRLRTYVSGGISVSQIDADAHSRVVNGKCRGPYLQHEKALARTFARRAGALGGIGLARASRPDRQLTPDDASSFSVYSTRSELDAAPAKFGVVVANALAQAETYWSGAVALLPADPSSTDWPRAVVWLRDGRVTRILVDVVVDGDQLGAVPTKLAAFFGSPGATRGTVSTWLLSDAATVTLDIGASASLTVENEQTGRASAAAAASAAMSTPPPTSTGPVQAHATASTSSGRTPTLPGPTSPSTDPGVARLKQCCNAIRGQARGFGQTPEAMTLMNIASQCDVTATQAGPGQVPNFNSVRQMLRGRVTPAACAGM